MPLVMCHVLVHIDFEEFDSNFDMVTQKTYCKVIEDRCNGALHEKTPHDVTSGATFL